MLWEAGKQVKYLRLVFGETGDRLFNSDPWWGTIFSSSLGVRTVARLLGETVKTRNFRVAQEEYV